MKYALLFGAGVERDFGLPIGGEYALESIINKNTEMTKAIKEINNYEYSSEFIFNRKDSLNFRRCVFETINYLLANPNIYKNSDITVYDLQQYIKSKNGIAVKIEDLSKESIEKISNLFSYIPNLSKDIFDETYISKNVEELIFKNFQYFGNIEQDFHCLINKNKYGQYKYYRLFNYFWSSYFSIINPIIEKIKGKQIKNSKYYHNIFIELENIVHNIFSKDLLKYYSDISEEKNYYHFFSTKDININCVLTTNYTPFVTLYFGEKAYYLSGRLDMFEKSEENIVYSLLDLDNEQNDLNKLDYFPFLMTQSPIKPIINSRQIANLSNAINKLNESDCLIIIGYGLCDNDNHILTIIKDYLKDHTKKLIYCYYNCDNENQATNKIKKILKLNDDNNQIIVLNNDGNAKKLYDLITNKLK